MKNVIIAPAFFYRFEQLKPFVESHMRAGVNGKILFLLEKHKPEYQDAVKRYNNFDIHIVENQERFSSRQQKIIIYPIVWALASLVSMNAECESMKPQVKPWILQTLHIHLKRHLIFRELLKTRLNDVDQVMITDTRDVIFQSDPFQQIQKGLYCGLESIKIGYEYHNHKWIESLYKGETQKYLFNQVVSCAGVTLGDYSSVKIYLERMVREILRLLPQVCFRPGLDQAIHNYIIYQNNSGLKITYSQNGDSLIATLGSSLLQEFLVEKERIYTRNKEIVSIIHQYHPHPVLRRHIEQTYG